LKHGIEVVLKQFIVNIDDNKIQKKHDIEVIFKEACVKPKGERKDAIKKLKPFVLKYSTFEFIKSELGKSCSGFQDKSNTLFRYPENNTFVNIDYDAFLRCVDAKSKGREILKDIGDLSDIIREINKAKNN
jgi:hypothetical protein